MPMGSTRAIRILAPVEADAAVRTLRERVESDCKPVPLDLYSTAEEHAWNERLEATSMILRHLHGGDASTVLGCFFDGEPVGLAFVDRPPPAPGDQGPSDEAIADGAPLRFLVTHPLSSGAGSALIEEAVALSQEWGYRGNLRLTSLDAGAVYRALGFEGNDFKMTLRPATSDKWSSREGRWCLKQYITKETAASTTDLQRQPPRPRDP